MAYVLRCPTCRYTTGAVGGPTRGLPACPNCGDELHGCQDDDPEPDADLVVSDG